MKKNFIIIISLFLLTACSSETKPTSAGQEEKDTVVSFMGVGDNLIHDTIYKDALNDDGVYDFKKMYKDIRKDIKDADISFINQETIIGGSELGLSGYPSFNSPSELAKNLNELDFNLVNLATNHSLDRSTNGINNALSTFNKYPNIVSDGIYSSQEDYDTIKTFKKKGITFSFISYTYGTNGIQAPNDYNVRYFNDDLIKSDIEKAKKISDVIIVSAHWGDENQFAPNDYQKHYAQLFADLDVDVVIGTHPHVIQPVEKLKGANGNETLVVYSLGNYIGGMLTTNNAISGMISFDFVKEASSDDINIKNIKWTPLIIHFEGDQNDILNKRYNYKTYKLENYTDKLASKHVLNGYEGNVVSIDYIKKITQEVIDSKFLK